jgi:hypothetical protein
MELNMGADTEALALEKLRAEIAKYKSDIETAYAQRHNWAEQERFWESMAWHSKAQIWVTIVAAIIGGLALILSRFGISV